MGLHRASDPALKSCWASGTPAACGLNGHFFNQMLELVALLD
jgi:hypothetical protein